LIRAYRIGHGRFIDEAMALLETRASPEQSLPAARELVHRAAAWIDQVCDQVGVVYEQERDRWVSSRSGLRQHWVNEVLSSASIDIGKVEEALNYRLNGHHVAAVMWLDDTVATRDVADVFDHAQSLLGTALLAAGPSLMVPTDEREARVWWPVDRLDCADVHTVFGRGDLSVRAAIGHSGHGIEGFRRSLREAEQAKVVALSGGPTVGRVVCHEHVAPVALMATNPADLRLFVQRTLGALAADDERSGLLRDTLREFLARNRSYAATAEAMFLHRNTIQYRVTQAMEACAASFDDVDGVADIQIALMGCRWMGKSVLSAAGPPR
jgi:DNA-binding PucR family transcriptional regulator